MPTRINEDGTPIITFDSVLEVSPFTLFKRLQSGAAPLLVDVRTSPAGLTLEGAISLSKESWIPEDSEREVVLFDEDGSLALDHAARLQQAGYERVKALFGGLELYEFALDPQVVGERTFLVPASTGPETSGEPPETT